MDDDHHDGGQALISPDKSHHDLNTKIMLTAIISLSFLVVLVTALHIYARCIIRRQSRRRADAVRRLGLPVLSQPPPAEPPKPGLDPLAIASLPIFVFKQAGESRVDECAVCLSFLEDGEMARLLPSCSHAFHAECIDRWLASHPTCPICRTEAESPAPSADPSGGAGPTAPPLEHVNSRLSSFRRMLSRERSSRRTQSCGEGEGGHNDIESPSS
ncbi:RING-H2 finger protein ATL40-like [Diospyros lotus]|uniref:RING-H2 finger protein ATL40-like n=1 Tax=Diospyros lotus TaxID=55363 RepID=UPI00225B11A0|nr:RING-H2 finger protein ATL40-like [Diospyros lotus]